MLLSIKSRLGASSIALTILLLAGVSCDRTGSVDTGGAIEIEVASLMVANIDSIRNLIMNHRSFKPFNSKRIVWFESLTQVDDPKDEKDRANDLTGQYQVRFYDYSQEKAYEVTVNLRDSAEMRLTPLEYQPKASLQEFDEASRILLDSLKLAHADVAQKLQLYPAMPTARLNSRNERSIIIGVEAQDAAIKPAIYGVSVLTGRLERLDTLYHVDFNQNLCEIPWNFSCENNGYDGSVHIRISQGSTTLWSFRAVRPAASSGHPDKGSGVELRHVYYRGKQVLYRAHVPILNVHYEKDLCGPYRDWQNAETCFDCIAGASYGSTGFRRCSAEPKTFVDDLDDAGNFHGVGIYVKGSDVLLVSELSAGWYRYVSEWTFSADGTLKPRFKFGGTANRCTCNLHFHHVYWRLDFDVDGASNNRVRERRKVWWGWKSRTFEKEEKSFRNARKKWRIENINGACYEMTPGSHDGNGDSEAWAKGDVYVVRYHSNELEDGVSCITCYGTSGTIQDQVFLTSENVSLTDVVLWYRSSFDHDAGHTHSGDHPEVVGPDLRPINGY